jgi:hypothetical protein
MMPLPFRRILDPASSGSFFLQLLSIVVHSPVDLQVTDPLGNTINKNTLSLTDDDVFQQIGDELYYSTDWSIDFNGLLGAAVLIPSPAAGLYTVTVTPKPGVSPTNTYSLTYIIGGVTSYLAQNAPVGNGNVFSLSLAPAITPPHLTIIPSGAGVVLGWPTNAAGFTLQSATDLIWPVWSPVSPGPVVVNGRNILTNPISGTQQFFRLSQ